VNIKITFQVNLYLLQMANVGSNPACPIF
jgi:hypothetical protein